MRVPPPPPRARPLRRTRGWIGGILTLTVSSLTLCTAVVFAQVTVPSPFVDQAIKSGLAAPVGMAFVPTDARLFVIEQRTGRMRLIVNGALSAIDPILTVDSLRTTHEEQGLLGIAADPGWPARPYVYVLYDALGNQMRIRRYTVAGDLAGSGSGQLTIDPASRRNIVVALPDVNGNHNGGTLRFGPDGKLYASMGEDGVPCQAQKTGEFHGKLLRMDVSGVPAGPGPPPSAASITPADNPFAINVDPEAKLVWQYGLRNPFRFHLDPANGDAFIADVGEDLFEEINWANAPGRNFGWPMLESNTTRYTCSGSTPAGTTLPIYVIDHASTSGGLSIVSGGVYRRPVTATSGFPPSYEGQYFFTDYFRGYIRRLARSGNTWSLAAAVPGQPNSTDWATGPGMITDMLVGPDGALWYCQQSGQVRRISYPTSVSVEPGSIARVEFLAPSPTPASGDVTLSYTLQRACEVRLELFDLAGRRLVALDPGALRSAGAHVLRWDGRDASGRPVGSGLVLARLTVNGEQHTRRILLTR